MGTKQGETSPSKTPLSLLWAKINKYEVIKNAHIVKMHNINKLFIIKLEKWA